MRAARTPPASNARGVMLLALLIVMMLGAVASAALVDTWATARRREQEEQLLFAGEQYRQAIRHYYLAGPRGQPRVLPERLDDLLDDTRSPVPLHHLRRLYPDPITGSSEWGLVMQGDRIAGVYSLSESEPLKQAGFDLANAAFEGKKSYREWVFAFNNNTARRVRR